jgi:hypothetical protein
MRKRAAIYVRVSTDKQTVENQVRELRQIAERRGGKLSRNTATRALAGPRGAKIAPAWIRCLRTPANAALTL